MHSDLKVNILVRSLSELKLRSVESFSMRLCRISKSSAEAADRQEVCVHHDVAWRTPEATDRKNPRTSYVPESRNFYNFVALHECIRQCTISVSEI
jgi:hypothetical protein